MSDNIIKKIRVGGVDYDLGGGFTSNLGEYARLTDLPDKLSDLENDLGYLNSESKITEDLLSQDLIEKLNGKEVTLDFGEGEDTMTLALLSDNNLLISAKTKNVKNLYFWVETTNEYKEYTGGEVDLADMDFLILKIVRTTESENAVVGLKLM